MSDDSVIKYYQKYTTELELKLRIQIWLEFMQ